MNNISINNGLFLGIVLVVSSLAIYFVNVEAFLLYKSYLLFIVVVLLYFKTANDIKKSNGGELSFMDGFKGILLASAVGFAICTIFEYIQFNIIDPTLADQLKDLTLEKMEEASAFVGSDQMDALVETIEEEEFGFSLSRSIMSYAIRMLFPAAVIGAIVSLITKKEKSPLAES